MPIVFTVEMTNDELYYLVDTDLQKLDFRLKLLKKLHYYIMLLKGA